MATEDLNRFLGVGGFRIPTWVSPRRAIIRCALPAGEETWQCEPFPGSEAARRHGCTCPYEQPWPGAYLFAVDCPVHELVAAPAPES